MALVFSLPWQSAIKQPYQSKLWARMRCILIRMSFVKQCSFQVKYVFVCIWEYTHAQQLSLAQLPDTKLLYRSLVWQSISRNQFRVWRSQIWKIINIDRGECIGYLFLKPEEVLWKLFQSFGAPSVTTHRGRNEVTFYIKIISLRGSLWWVPAWQFRELYQIFLCFLVVDPSLDQSLCINSATVHSNRIMCFGKRNSTFLRWKELNIFSSYNELV